MAGEYMVSAAEMKRFDENTSKHFGVAALILMEKAALLASLEIKARYPGKHRVLVVAGTGNNGGDGIALGRILYLQGFLVDVVLVGDRHKCTAETNKQIEIIEKYGCLVQNKIKRQEYDIMIDAVFGIGLTRDVEGEYAQAIEKINEAEGYVCSLDIPSGIDSDTGQVRKTAVKADLTIAFAFRKWGHILYPGCVYAGEVVVCDIGITSESFLGEVPRCHTYTGKAADLLPARSKDGNKGTFGKLLIIAGSPHMSGACQLSAKSAYRIGAGMVKVFVPDQNSSIMQINVPEALVSTYSVDEPGDGQTRADQMIEDLERDLSWADTVLIGPGLSKSRRAYRLMETVLSKVSHPLVIDADGLNLLAESGELQALLQNTSRKVILTPHAVEFARLTGQSVAEVKRDTWLKAKELADRYHCVVVCKDARTVVASCKEPGWYINSNGNDGMAVAGSGDVLAGIIAGLLAQGMNAFAAATAGVYFHGAVGDSLAERIGRHAMIAGDMAEEIKRAGFVR